MKEKGQWLSRAALALPVLLAGVPAAAQPLTADRAVELALAHSSAAVNAEASVLDSKSGLYSAYAGILPRASASLSRSVNGVKNNTGSQVFGNFVTPSVTYDREAYSTTPGLSASWNVFNLSALSGLSSARNNLRAARNQRVASRQRIEFDTRQQFYEVVKAVHLAQVANGSLKLARDDERRVHALFDVGSVSRSDLLSAQVRTAQSQLDSLVAQQTITDQRVALATLLGLRESEMGQVDTSLSVEPRTYDEATLLAEAERNRPDLKAAEAALRAAHAGLNAARFLRLPYVSLSGGVDFNPTTATKFTEKDSMPIVTRTETDRTYSAAVSLNWDFFSGFSTDGRIASARAQLLRAKDSRDALRRNLASEVEQALLVYQRAVESDRVARRAVESAGEKLKLTQEKYNVGSATILELIDAQVQLQRAQSDGVSALAAIRVAEAQIERVRGHGGGR